MSRSINKAQNEIMLNAMQKNRSIACGFAKISKEVLAEFWSSLTQELNSAGPPIKNITEWKKVWIDQKRYVRSKAALNIKNQRVTGGGLNQIKGLTEKEEVIYELVGMRESVEGLVNSFKFELPECSSGTEEENNPETPPADFSKQIDSPCCSQQTTLPSHSFGNIETSASKIYTKKPLEKLTTIDRIAKEVAAEENVCSEITELCDSIKQSYKEVEFGIKRVCHALEKSNELKTKKIKIQERHNAVIEDLRRKEVQSKIEKNKKLIEIEEIKLKILAKNNHFLLLK